MGSLSASLLGAANALDAYQYALGVSQNNIDNASTPGYAKQQVVLQSRAFDPSTGLSGGVDRGELVNSRDLLAERNVWEQAAAQGDASARNQALSGIEAALPVSEGSGIPGALNAFFNDVSAWSASPNDGSIRQAVLDSANAVVQSFGSTAAALANVAQSTDQSIQDTVGQVNRLSTELSNLNAEIHRGGQKDAGLEAQIYSTLESLSSLVDLTVLPQQDGTLSVSLAGGAPLVIGSSSYALKATNAPASAQTIDQNAPPHAAIRAADGSDITGQIHSGKLHGLLQTRNVTLPGIIGDSTQPGALNELAQGMALRVNQIVGQATDVNQATSGFFLTDPTQPASAAANLAMDPAVTGSSLATADRNGVPNGIPLALAALANPRSGADQIHNVSYTVFYGNTAAQIGRGVNQAQNDQDLTTQTLAQARSSRQSVSGVSLDAEAITILQFQQAYQAAAKLVSTLDNLTQTIINMIQP
ncbi:MAG: flagellar hook-associated protein FlgK [Bryobacteraceae bacterium]